MVPAPHPTDDAGQTSGLLTRLPTTVKWFLMITLSVVIVGVMEYFRLPAALLLGPMIAGLIFATNGAQLSLPRLPYMAAQALIGCVIAGSLNTKIMLRFLEEWPLFMAAVLSIVAMSSLLGYIMAKRQIFPGTTAVWGTSAGGASAMILMAEAHGADVRLVAFMQYFRVVCVASAAAAVAALMFNISGAQHPPLDFFPPFEWRDLTITLALTALTSYLGKILKIPAGTMLVPMLSLAVLHAFELITIVLPLWLLAIAYAMIGWRIGLAFTRRLIRHVAIAAPQVALSIFILIVFGGCLAFLLTTFLDVDPLTAYLATSPGGLDSVAIIAATTHVDMPFVMALQTVRFLVILALGPHISRFIAKRIQT
ncbi:membrane AbrB-like protein [Agrobacterium vitis]|nr:membrane AbrB-like protein [Agrobacterium vitis]MBE1440088.1 membrane AbrB-like protein [Agrobacterium vitis]